MFYNTETNVGIPHEPNLILCQFYLNQAGPV